MPYPPLLALNSAAEYRTHFENIYCRGPIVTFDGIAVRFRKKDFNHCFFESVAAKDDTFSQKRAERMEWIQAALKDPSADLYVGWDNKTKQQALDRRVAVVLQDYVVVIRLTDMASTPIQAEFITAYVADTARTLTMIKSGPKWVSPKTNIPLIRQAGSAGKPF